MEFDFISYELKPAVFEPFDPLLPQLAAAIIDALKHDDYEYCHIGSTSFGACGKGIIDISLLYRIQSGDDKLGAIAPIVQFLNSHGFTPQHSSNPFPKTRPRFDIGVRFRGKDYQVHLHVIENSSKEHKQQLLFKNKMLSDPELLNAYERKKQSILLEGKTDQDAYGKEKGYFVKDWLSKRTFAD